MDALGRAPIEHRDVNCARCASYAHCRAIEARHAAELAANGGNWRAVFHPEGGRVGTPIRRCSGAILERYAHLFEDADVLEIGCGPHSAVTEAFCRQRRARYVGIDPARLPVFEIPWLPFRARQRRVFEKLVRFGLHATSPSRRFVLDRFPSPALRGREFDLVYGTSTLEHWHEDLTDREETRRAYREDVRECWRLLRPGGVLLMDVPMFVHGNIWFMRGDVALVESIFGGEWRTVVLEHWRERHDDLAPYCPERRRAVFAERFGIDLRNIWILNAVATK